MGVEGGRGICELAARQKDRDRPAENRRSKR